MAYTYKAEVQALADLIDFLDNAESMEPITTEEIKGNTSLTIQLTYGFTTVTLEGSDVGYTQAAQEIENLLSSLKRRWRDTAAMIAKEIADGLGDPPANSRVIR